MEQHKLHNLIERTLKHVCVVNNTPTQYYYLIIHYNPLILSGQGDLYLINEYYDICDKIL